jgi:hypothetical protein
MKVPRINPLKQQMHSRSLFNIKYISDSSTNTNHGNWYYIHRQIDCFTCPGYPSSNRYKSPSLQKIKYITQQIRQTNVHNWGDDCLVTVQFSDQKSSVPGFKLLKRIWWVNKPLAEMVSWLVALMISIPCVGENIRLRLKKNSHLF